MPRAFRAIGRFFSHPIVSAVGNIYTLVTVPGLGAIVLAALGNFFDAPVLFYVAIVPAVIALVGVIVVAARQGGTLPSTPASSPLRPEAALGQGAQGAQSHGIVVKDSRGGCVEGNRISGGFDIGVGVYDSEGIETGGNEINKSDGTPDPCGDPKERLKELAKSARRLGHHLANFDSWRPAVANKDFDGWVDGRHTTHAAAMQTLLFGFARFFSAAWTYEEQCDTHGDWNEVMEWARDVYRALSVDPSGLDDYPLMSEPLHEVGERSTPGFGKADARPIQLVEFRTQMADDPRFAEYFEPLRTLLKKASPNGPDTPARARLRAVEESVKRVEEGLAAKDFRP